MSSQTLRELVEIIAKALVDDPESVHVDAVGSGRHPRLELSVAQDDIGKVIGKDGRTAQSMRVLLNAAASKLDGGRAYLDIVD